MSGKRLVQFTFGCKKFAGDFRAGFAMTRLRAASEVDASFLLSIPKKLCRRLARRPVVVDYAAMLSSEPGTASDFVAREVQRNAKSDLRRAIASLFVLSIGNGLERGTHR
jgi:hypothetical protein